ncbi:hypothetical protein IAQ61_000884 [Plenodomus lingam]|uniref:Predicted protein n=1 Tax=Leptosphaeria maculans (strain JN3 / isolate v23.1.3 / race Av1-4-5-6-7-8) TaxID=985895 RepID=E5A256_LEPMJ|nr:predicted protein [Plenodomus lingam JN3]KAH9880591.1 hypothetical protein IAQ61_000884 [Plenodomus lingam]CBX97933.1 predicted protein [Plenodomus lingam JN3]
MERPPRHSIQNISAKRAGGKKVPRPYRKYHNQAHRKKTTNKEAGHVAAKASSFFVRATRAAFEALS